MTRTINESIQQMIDSLRQPSGRAARFADPGYVARLKAVNESVVAPAFAGDRYARLDLHEAMTRSDFPILFGDILYRRLARAYQARPSIWPSVAKRVVAPDFRKQSLVDVLGGKGVLDDIAELAPYPRRALSESAIEFQVGKTGATIAYSWEAGVNDDLAAFQSLPERLAQAARHTEDFKMTQVFATATGPASWLGTPATAALTTDNLQSAIGSITNAVDEDGNPVFVDTPVLMVPPALELTAREIVNTVKVSRSSGGKTLEVAGNGLSATPKVVVNPFLSAIDKSGKAGTTWYLFAGPDSDRPAALEVFLAGHESPDIRLRADAGVRLGGGEVDPLDGGFERDDIEYRVRHVVAAANAYDDAVYVSTGS